MSITLLRQTATKRALGRDRGQRWRPPEEAANGHALAAHLENFLVISCDVFDTAIRRRLARPEDVLLVIAAQARARGLISCAAEAFPEFRRSVEEAARREAIAAGDDEVDIQTVYARLVDYGIVRDAMAAAALEGAVERAVAVAVPGVRDVLLARRPGQRLVFLSDSILPGAWLATLLAACGYGEACEVFSSADARRSKHTGRIFPWLLERLGCPASDILHLGDNPISDVARARAHGLAALHLPWPARPPPEPAAVASHPLTLRLAHSLRRAADAAPQAGAPQAGVSSAAPPLARHVSVLMLGFTLFVLSEARRRGMKRIFFSARDGHLPLAIARRLVARSGEPFELSYLEVSRQSVVLPGLARDPAQLAELLGHSVRGHRLASLLAPIGIDPAITAPLLVRLGFDPDHIVVEHEGHATARGLIEREKSLIEATLAARRQATLGYLEQTGFLAPGKRMIVDVGWRGSVQFHLAGFAGIPADDLFGCYLGLFPEALRPGFTPRHASGYLFSFGHPKALCDLVREGYILFELFFSAPHGSVARHETGPDGRFTAIHAAEMAPEGVLRRDFFNVLERDCLAEIDALDALLEGAWPEAIDPEAALFDIARLLSRPSRADVARINALPFVHGVGGQRISVAVNPVPLHEMARHPGRSLRRLAQAPWRAGAVRASLPWPLPDMSYAELCHRYDRLRQLLRRGG